MNSNLGNVLKDPTDAMKLSVKKSQKNLAANEDHQPKGSSLKLKLNQKFQDAVTKTQQ